MTRPVLKSSGLSFSSFTKYSCLLLISALISPSTEPMLNMLVLLVFSISEKSDSSSFSNSVTTSEIER